MKKTKLMVPGPVEVSNSTLERMASAQIPHYSQEAIDIYNSCVSRLKQIMGVADEGNVFIMPGSGSVVMDICAASVISQGDTVISAVNGTFSNRFKSIVQSYGAQPVEIRVDHGRMITPAMVEKQLKAHSDVRAIFIAHLETSTGVLNPIEEIGEVAARYDVPLVVDAVSSIGVERFLMDEWKVSVCCSASQKGLETPAGLGIVCVSERGWKAIERNTPHSNGWFADLNLWKKATQGNEIRKGIFYPLTVTMPVNNIMALDESLSLIMEEGIHTRIDRHARIAAATREGLLDCGFMSFPEEGGCSNVETVMRNNLGIDINEMIQFIKKMYNTEISNGLFDLYNKIVRVGHIGQTATLDSVVPVLVGIEQFLRMKGRDIPLGASLSGVEKNYTKIVVSNNT